MGLGLWFSVAGFGLWFWVPGFGSVGLLCGFVSVGLCSCFWFVDLDPCFGSLFWVPVLGPCFGVPLCPDPAPRKGWAALRAVQFSRAGSTSLLGCGTHSARLWGAVPTIRAGLWLFSGGKCRVAPGEQNLCLPWASLDKGDSKNLNGNKMRTTPSS